MNKYQNGKIYKIVDVGYNKCYIGSTCEALSQRMARHRSNYKRYLQGKHLAHTSSFFCLMNSAFKTVKLNGLKTIHVTIKMNQRDVRDITLRKVIVSIKLLQVERQKNFIRTHMNINYKDLKITTATIGTKSQIERRKK